MHLSQTCDHICAPTTTTCELPHTHFHSKQSKGWDSHSLLPGTPAHRADSWVLHHMRVIPGGDRASLHPSCARAGSGQTIRASTSNSLSRSQHPSSARSVSSTGTTLFPARPSILVQQAFSEYFVSTSDDSAIFHQCQGPQIFYLQMTHTSQPSGRCERFGRRRIC